jgi:outer membrane lipoprotein-sorting protein
MRTWIVLALLLAPGLAAAGPATQTLKSVKTYYGGVKQYSADFEQEVVNATFGSTKKNTGTLKLKPKAKMRWDYAAKKSFISTGKKLWYIDVAAKQYAERKLSDTVLPVAVTFLHGKGNLEKEFTADLDASGAYGGSGDTVVELTPKQASTQYKRVYLVVASDGSVSETVVVDPSDNINHFRFSNVDTTKAIPEKVFQVDRKKLSKYRRVR